MRHYLHAFDEEEVGQWIARNIERYQVFGFELWAVVLMETGELIGDCGITMQNIGGFIRPEIGYHINRRYQCRGYAKEAARACRDYAFENTPFNILYSYMRRENTASAATALANGMHMVEEYRSLEGESILVNAITRQEWAELPEKRSSKQEKFPRGEASR